MLTRRYPISIDEAQAKLNALSVTTDTETISVDEANHRVLAQAVVAPYATHIFAALVTMVMPFEPKMTRIILKFSRWSAIFQPVQPLTVHWVKMKQPAL
nr:hypothetical protein [Secundilactobacillus odoratitofui]